MGLLRALVFKDPPASWSDLHPVALRLTSARECNEGVARVADGVDRDISHLASRQGVTALYLDMPAETAVDLDAVTDVYVGYDFRSSDRELEKLLKHLPNVERLDLSPAPNGEKLSVGFLGELSRLRWLRAAAVNLDSGSPGEVAMPIRIERIFLHAGRKFELEWLAALGDLEVVWLEGARSVSPLLGNPTIRSLSLVDCAEIPSLEKLNFRRLQTLHVASCNLRALEGAAEIESLTELRITDCPVTDLAPLSKSIRLRSIEMLDQAVVPEFGNAEYESLERFVLRGSSEPELRIPDSRWAALMPNLRELVIDVKMEDEDLTAIEQLPRLSRLKLFGDFSQEQLARIESRAELEFTVQSRAQSAPTRAASGTELASGEQALIVRFSRNPSAPSDEFEARLFELEDDLIEACFGTGFEYDGHEFDTEGGRVFVYGASADEMAAVLLPVVRKSSLAEGATYLKRYGKAGEGAREVRGSVGV